VTEYYLQRMGFKSSDQRM